MDDRTVRAPLGWSAPTEMVFGADAVIRTDFVGSKCRSGCKTKDHPSYDACLKAANVRTYLASPSKGLDGTKQKRWDSELHEYREARRQGIQPDGTTKAKVEQAVKASDQAGAAYGRDFSMADPA